MGQFDSYTIIFFLIVNTSIIILLFSVFSISNKFRFWPINTLVLAKIFELISLFGFLYRGEVNDFTSIALSNVALLIGYGLEAFSLISYDGKLRKNILRVFVIFTVALAILFLILYKQPTYIRILIVTIVILFNFGYLGIFLLYKSNRSFFSVLLGGIYIVYVAINLARAGYVLVEKENYSFLTNLSVFDALTFIASNLIITIGSLGFLLLIKEEDESKIKLKNKIIEEDIEKLKSLNTKKDTFFSIIGHDLKNPINSLTNLSEMLTKDHKKLSEVEREKFINSIYNSSRKTYNLLNNLLLWARSESGRMEVKPQVIRVKELLGVNIYFFSEKINEKDINIITDIDDSLDIVADYEMMNTVIRNILSNAIKFSDNSSDITVSAIKDSASNMAHISIQDKGIGIPENFIEGLFDLDSAYIANDTENKKGTGLGLKLCKEFVVKNGGKIWVDSKNGKGSTFTFSVPLK